MGFILEGSRNDTLFSIASAMFGRGESYATVLREVLKQNTWCKPPLADREVRGIVDSASKYECNVRENFIELWMTDRAMPSTLSEAEWDVVNRLNGNVK